MAATVAALVERIRSSGERDAAPNARGNAIWRWWWHAERYVVDFAPDFAEAGWLQFDTDQDAHYFGVWVNPRLLFTLTYAEGDWILVECPDAAHYNAEVWYAIEFLGEGFIFKAVDVDGGVTEVRQDRREFLIAEVA